MTQSKLANLLGILNKDLDILLNSMGFKIANEQTLTPLGVRARIGTHQKDASGATSISWATGAADIILEYSLKDATSCANMILAKLSTVVELNQSPDPDAVARIGSVWKLAHEYLGEAVHVKGAFDIARKHINSDARYLNIKQFYKVDPFQVYERPVSLI